MTFNSRLAHAARRATAVSDKIVERSAARAVALYARVARGQGTEHERSRAVGFVVQLVERANAERGGDQPLALEFARGYLARLSPRPTADFAAAVLAALGLADE